MTKHSHTFSKLALRLKSLLSHLDINGSHKNIRACHFFRVKSFKFVMRNNEGTSSPLPRHSRVIQSAEKMTRTNGPEISQNRIY